MPNIQLLDGKKIPFDKKINGFDLIKKISKSLEKKALIMEVDGILKDLTFENINLELAKDEIINKEKTKTNNQKRPSIIFYFAISLIILILPYKAISKLP